MPGETTHFKIKYAQAADETKAFPAEVGQPQAEKIDEVLYEGNKVAAGQAYVGHGGLAKETPTGYSATRATLVVATFPAKAVETMRVKAYIEGVEIAALAIQGSAESANNVPITFVLPAGAKWEWRVEGGHNPLECKVSTLAL